jgi:hypothetical protein
MFNEKILRFASIGHTAFKSKSIEDKIVVIESDDWGSIRSPIGFQDLNLIGKSKFGIDLNRSPYLTYDKLESGDDMNCLLNFLIELNEKYELQVKITLNYVTNNPDFDRIKENRFQEYYHEKFTDTYMKYYGSNSAFDLFLEGCEMGFFEAQFHGREHVNVNFWLELLRNQNKYFKFAFDNRFWGIGPDVLPSINRNIQATLDFRDESERQYICDSLISGLNEFKSIFKYTPVSFIPNNYIMHPSIEFLLYNNGIKYLQGMKKRAYPKKEFEIKRKLEMRRAGIINENGLLDLVRNCKFEPSFMNKNKVVDMCLSEISSSFFWKQPAIISMHRLNFMGGNSYENRSENLTLFRNLVLKIKDNWPTVKFKTTSELGDYYSGI